MLNTLSHEIPTGFATRDYLRLISLSVIAGFAGIKMLNRLSNMVSEQMLNASKAAIDLEDE